jgi:hypothetical protein
MMGDAADDAIDREMEELERDIERGPYRDPDAEMYDDRNDEDLWDEEGW